MKASEECTIPCNLCASRTVETLSLKDRERRYLRTVICKNCGLIWTDPRPSEEAIQTFYTTKYRQEYKQITRPKKKHVYRDAQEALRRYAFFRNFLSKGDRILDIGAGNGVFVYTLRQRGIAAQGIEPDAHHAQYAREILNIPVATGFSQDISSKEDCNIITLHHVLEHMTNPLDELHHIWSLLTPRGYLVVEVPNAENIQQDPQNRYHKAHIYTFNPATLLALGKQAGFSPCITNIAPLNGNISVVFQKGRKEKPQPVQIPENFLKITKILHQHTSFVHFTSSIPYIKLGTHCLNALQEQLALIRAGQKDDQEIIQQVMQEWRDYSKEIHP